MTDSINRVSGTQGPSAGGTYSGGSFSEHRKKRDTPGPQADLIEISQDARDRLGGKTKKSLLEYLKELLS